MFLNIGLIYSFLQILVGKSGIVNAADCAWDQNAKDYMQMNFGTAGQNLWDFTDWNLTFTRDFKSIVRSCNEYEGRKFKFKLFCNIIGTSIWTEKHFSVTYSSSNSLIQKVDQNKKFESVNCKKCNNPTIVSLDGALNGGKKPIGNHGTTVFWFGPGVYDELVKLEDVTKNSVRVMLNTVKNNDCSGVSYRIELTNEDRPFENPVTISSNGGTSNFNNLESCSNYKLKIFPVYQGKNGYAIEKM